MTRKEFVEKLFGQKLFTENNYALLAGAEKGCQGFKCIDNDSLACKKCKYYGFWNKEINMSNIAKTVLNMLYGSECQLVIGGRGTGKSRVEGVLLTQGWKKLPSLFNRTPLNILYDILDDATANGFEVQVHNGVIYYREGTCHSTDSTQDID